MALAGSSPHAKHRIADRPSPSIDRMSYDKAVANLDCESIKSIDPAIFSLSRTYSNILNRKDVASGAVAQKDQFETAQDYSARLDDLWRKPLGSATTIVIDQTIGPSAEYNADRELLTIDNLIHKLDKDSNAPSASGYSSNVMVGGNESSSTYVGSNAFGVSRKIDVMKLTTLNFVFSERVLGYPFRDGIGFLDAGLIIDKNLAKAVMTRGHIVWIADAKSPFASYELYRDRPTLDSPTDVRSHDYNLSVKLKCVLFTVDGHIVAKYVVPDA